MRSAPLKGLQKVSVSISPAILQDGKSVEGFDQKALKDLVEVKLRSLGLAIQPDLVPLSTPSLTIMLDCHGLGTKVDYVVQVKLVEPMKLMRDPSILAYVASWESSFMGMDLQERFDSAIRDAVTKQMDSFCNDYLRANPKK